MVRKVNNKSFILKGRSLLSSSSWISIKSTNRFKIQLTRSWFLNKVSRAVSENPIGSFADEDLTSLRHLEKVPLHGSFQFFLTNESHFSISSTRSVLKSSLQWTHGPGLLWKETVSTNKQFDSTASEPTIRSTRTL